MRIRPALNLALMSLTRMLPPTPVLPTVVSTPTSSGLTPGQTLKPVLRTPTPRLAPTAMLMEVPTPTPTVTPTLVLTLTLMLALALAGLLTLALMPTVTLAQSLALTPRQAVTLVVLIPAPTSGQALRLSPPMMSPTKGS